MDPFTNERLLLITFGWWQFSVCLFAFAALMAIWWHLGRRESDKGQVWLAVSVLCWSLSGLVEVYYSNILDSAQSIDLVKSNMGSLKSILSLCNSLFILLALPYFKYLPNKLSSVIESDLWKYIVGIPFLLAFSPIFAKYAFGRQYNFINDLDVYYSILTLVFLGAVLWESFAKRQLKSLSILSLICIIITFVAQLYKPLDDTLNQLIFSAIFKSCLIMIFFALALSWVKEIFEESVENPIFNPDSKAISIKLTKDNVILSGIWPEKEHHISLTETLRNKLTLLINNKLDEDKWAKMKNKVGHQRYDFDDTQLTRILSSIAYGIIGDELRNSLIERESSRIKLKQLSENLIIEED